MSRVQQKKLSKQERQYQKIVILNQQLTEELNKPKIPVSQASDALVSYVQNTTDPLLPAIWGRNEADPYADKPSSSCCIIICIFANFFVEIVLKTGLVFADE
ncbi:hypothetical protein BB561_001914 [Smittium simulii]|uniref:Guanine nucleotide-binding protein subunit gamma n=1 Tax=Smittium simulii TaxID=133385 RepID=A0A2T9YSI7_9FUNG|nr:hypothetical protein BB561_001914 [Smittium simulii]